VLFIDFNGFTSKTPRKNFEKNTLNFETLHFKNRYLRILIQFQFYNTDLKTGRTRLQKSVVMEEEQQDAYYLLTIILFLQINSPTSTFSLSSLILPASHSGGMEEIY
jgi:hypothetical protein